MIYELKCCFCSKLLGQIDIQDKFLNGPVDERSLGIADNRCENCENQNGNYKKMHEFYMEHIEQDGNKATEALRACAKKADVFFDHLVTKSPRLIFVTNDIPVFEAKRQQLVKDLNLQDLEPYDQRDVIEQAVKNNPSVTKVSQLSSELIEQVKTDFIILKANKIN